MIIALLRMVYQPANRWYRAAAEISALVLIVALTLFDQSNYPTSILPVSLAMYAFQAFVVWAFLWPVVYAHLLLFHDRPIIRVRGFIPHAALAQIAATLLYFVYSVFTVPGYPVWGPSDLVYTPSFRDKAAVYFCGQWLIFMTVIPALVVGVAWTITRWSGLVRGSPVTSTPLGMASTATSPLDATIAALNATLPGDPMPDPSAPPTDYRSACAVFDIDPSSPLNYALLRFHDLMRRYNPEGANDPRTVGQREHDLKRVRVAWGLIQAHHEGQDAEPQNAPLVEDTDDHDTPVDEFEPLPNTYVDACKMIGISLYATATQATTQLKILHDRYDPEHATHPEDYDHEWASWVISEYHTLDVTNYESACEFLGVLPNSTLDLAEQWYHHLIDRYTQDKATNPTEREQCEHQTQRVNQAWATVQAAHSDTLAPSP